MITKEELEHLAAGYADQALMEVNPRLALAEYHRPIKMHAPCFSGDDIAAAWLAGWCAREQLNDNNQ
jgi:hypothetical protein